MLIIFALLASLLRSYSQPLIILAGIPFGAAGAFIGHFMLGYNLSFYSLFGVVALAGVVVNDSLILMDKYNRLMKEGGYSCEEAVLKATERRFRPIFLTTATTSLGMIPLIFETSTIHYPVGHQPGDWHSVCQHPHPLRGADHDRDSSQCHEKIRPALGQSDARLISILSFAK